MSDREIDWKRHEERYLYDTLGHYAVFERPHRKPEHRSPMQRVMRRIKELRGQRYWDHIVDGGCHRSLHPLMHESWFQLPAEQKEERLLRHVDWTGVSEPTRVKVIAWQLRSRDGEINAQDEWHLHDQLMRVEATTPGWNELSSTAKLETLLRSKDVDWRPFPPEFQAIALGSMIRRVVTPGRDGGFEIGGVFEAGTDYPPFGRYRHSKDRDSFEQTKRKSPKRPVFSKAEARSDFRWAVEERRWEAFVKQHGDADREAFREEMRPLWQEFWDAAKKLDRDGLSSLTFKWYSRTNESLEQQEHPRQSPGDGEAERGANKQQHSGYQLPAAEPNPSAAANDYARTLDATARRAQPRDPDRSIDR
jgi:hypothetical protein